MGGDKQENADGEFLVQRHGESVYDAYVRRVAPEDLPIAVVGVGDREFDVPLWALPKDVVAGTTLRISSRIVKVPTPQESAELLREEVRLRTEMAAQHRAEEEARRNAEAAAKGREEKETINEAQQ